MKSRSFSMLSCAVMIGIVVVVGACGGDDSAALVNAQATAAANSDTQSDRALFESMAAAWNDNDVSAAKEIYAPEAMVYWTDGDAVTRTSGADEIGAAVRAFSVGFVPAGGIHTYTLAADELPQLGPSYGGLRYVAGPVAREGRLYMVVIGIHGGLIAEQWVTPLYP